MVFKYLKGVYITVYWCILRMAKQKASAVHPIPADRSFNIPDEYTYCRMEKTSRFTTEAKNIQIAYSSSGRIVRCRWWKDLSTGSWMEHSRLYQNYYFNSTLCTSTISEPSSPVCRSSFQTRHMERIEDFWRNQTIGIRSQTEDHHHEFRKGSNEGSTRSVWRSRNSWMFLPPGVKHLPQNPNQRSTGTLSEWWRCCSISKNACSIGMCSGRSIHQSIRNNPERDVEGTANGCQLLLRYVQWLLTSESSRKANARTQSLECI